MTVNVRFVPKGSSFISFDELHTVPVAQAADLVEPSKRDADRGRRLLMERGVSPETTSLNRLVAEMTDAQFRQMFGRAELVTEKHADKRVITQEASFQRPVEALQVPEALQGAIAFAYVPRPVEYYSPQAVPPHEDVYHLRLADVAMALNAPRCHQSGWTGRGSKVAMADSGFFLHPWFVRSGYQLLPTQSPGSGPADIDASGHGTGEAANIFAVAPGCTVYGVKQGSSSAGTLETCIDQKPHVMTNSWGFDIDKRSRDELRAADPDMFAELIDIESVINRAVAAGICVLFSAGNGHRAFPACFPAVIAVGGVTLNEDGSVEASNYASGFESKLYAGRNVPDVCGLVGRSGAAPQSAHIMLPVPPDSALDGLNFPSGAKKSGWGIFSGTSAACPQVAGLVALMKQISGALTPAQIRQVLQARAIDVTKGKTATGTTAKAGTDVATGAGLADALRACGYVAGVP